MKLIINQQFIDLMRTHLEENYPHEACGFFSGNDEAQVRDIGDLWTVANKSTENLKRRFLIDPIDYLKAERRVLKNQTNLLGLFHSHPDHPAYPSKHDLAAAQPYFSYIIASVENGKLGDVRSFRLINDEFHEEEVIINP